MTVKFLANMLIPEVKVTLKDMETGETYYEGTAAEIIEKNISDKVVDWDFSNGNVIYL